MITLMNGDMFDVFSDVRVNTVNCVGVMGAGVALTFKRRYPTMFYDYAKRCRRQEVKPGCPFLWQGDNTIVVNFPTKDHWRRPAQYSYIENGLAWLSAYLLDNPNLSISIPPLGCGNGGLEWDVVNTLIHDHLAGLDNHILLFPPATTPGYTTEVRRSLKGKTQWPV